MDRTCSAGASEDLNRSGSVMSARVSRYLFQQRREACFRGNLYRQCHSCSELSRRKIKDRFHETARSPNKGLVPAEQCIAES